jgi:hypothetical protein
LSGKNMGIPSFGEDVAAAAKRSGYEGVISDIRPEGPPKARKSRWSAALLQLFFGYVGCGYFYLGQTRRWLASCAVFLLGGAAALYLRMQAHPAAADIGEVSGLPDIVSLSLAAALAFVYAAAVADCYGIGAAGEKAGAGRGGYEGMKPRKLTPQEELDRVFGEHDDRRLGENP